MEREMKPSGISWIGDIPQGWEIKRISYMSDSRSGGTPDRDILEYWENGTIPWMSSGEVNKTYVYETDEKITELAIRNSSAKILKANSVMVALNGQGKTKGMSAILKISASCNQSLCAFSCYSDMLDYRYLFWCFQEMYYYLRHMSGDSVRDGLAANYVKNQKIPTPLLAEQQAIADFLDKQCAKIDSIAADIEKQIELLQKYKKSLITETVTKGLNRSAPMKDSGIEWIGEIPEHWEITRMQDIGVYKKGPFGSAITLDMFIDKDDTAIKVYEQKNAINADASLGWYYISPIDYSNLKDFTVMPGDIIVSCAGTIGKCYIMPNEIEKGIINQALMKITLIPEVNKEYFLHIFYVALEYMSEKYSNGSAIKNIPPFSILKKQSIPLPDIKEQRKIANSLSNKLSSLSETIAVKESQLATIQQYKKSLIYEYVTGKKRVSEVKI